MVERLVIVAALAAGLTVLIWLGRRLAQRRMATLADQHIFADLLPAGVPAVVAFTLPGCGDCRARQEPALRRLADRIGNRAAVLSLRADEHATLADKLGLLTVPATVVIAADGRLRALNQGYADDELLAGQLNLG
ncbi:MAG: thioredoxin family protein [Oscillochloris sp.]|nr:thioredoxin family protein [Oscillochloris sp.]